jgi:hypothetical protein
MLNPKMLRVVSGFVQIFSKKIEIVDGATKLDVRAILVTVSSYFLLIEFKEAVQVADILLKELTFWKQ